MSKKQTTSAPAPEQVSKKNIGYRLLAVLLLAICVGTFFLPIKTFVASHWAVDVWAVEGHNCLETQTLTTTISQLLKSENKLFGVIPVLLESQGFIALVADLALYGFVVAIAIAAILALIALFTAKRSPALTRASVFLLTWAAAGYTLSIAGITCFISIEPATIDLVTLAIAGAGALLYFVLMLAKNGKVAGRSLLHLVLSLCVSALLIFAFVDDGYYLSEGMKDSVAMWIMIAVVVLAFINLFVATWRAMSKKFNKFDIFRFVVQLIIAVIPCFMCVIMKMDMAETSLLLYSLLATVVAALQLALALMQRAKRAKVQIAETVEAELAEFQTEEYVEAYAYDGGPVAGVEIAEEVNPTAAALTAAKDWDAAAQATMASLLGNGFDPFLIMLTESEKEEFIDLYVLKCKGIMPEIPGYVVGGDNKEFFDKVFIYLGQYREKIPADLLSKMYKFSMKI